MFLKKLYEDAKRGGSVPGKMDLGDILHVADEAIEAACNKAIDVASETIKTEEPDNIPNWALFSMLIAGGLKSLKARIEDGED